MIIEVIETLLGISRWKRIQREKQEREYNFRPLQQVQKDGKARRMILSYPEKEMAKEEFEKLPHLKDLNWETCPYDTWFVCAPNDLLPGVIVLGHKVEYLRLICEQMGARTSDYDSCYNRYRLKLI